MGIFLFWARSKHPRDLKSWGWRSGIENPQKSPKIPDLGDGDSGFLRFLGVFFEDLGFFRGLGIFLIWGFFQILGFSSQGLRIVKIWGFLSPGFFGDRDFSGWGFIFEGSGYPTRKPPLLDSCPYNFFLETAIIMCSYLSGNF